MNQTTIYHSDNGKMRACPKCGAGFVWQEYAGKKEGYRVYRLICICGWSVESYQFVDVIPAEKRQKREKLANLKIDKNQCCLAGKARKPRLVKFTCIICGKENEIITLGNPATCPGECREKLQNIRANKNKSRLLPHVRSPYIRI